MSTTITASTSVVLVATSVGAPTDHIVYFPNLSTIGRLLTVRDNDGQASLINPIIMSTIGNATFNTGYNSIFINQPFGFVTLTTQPNGLYSVVNTFAFPAEQSAANIQSLNAQTITVSSNIQLIDRANNFPNSLYTSANQLILNSSFVGDITEFELQSTVNALGTIGYLSTIPDYFPIPPKWVAVGMSSNNFIAPNNVSSPINSIQYSLDSIVWSPVTGTRGFTQYGIAVAHTDYLFVAVGANETGAPNTGYIQWSLDSSNWQPSFAPLLNSNQIRTDVHYANGIWHAVGSNTLGGSNTILWSIDGKTWIPSQNEPFKSVTSGFGYATGITYGNGVWVCSGSQNDSGPNASILWSSNGSNWSPATSVSWTGQTVYNVAFDGIKFICLPQNGTTASSRNVATSLDGKTWTSLSVAGGDFNNLPRYIAGNQKQWIITSGDTNKSLVYSLDGGITWQTNANLSSCNLNMYKPYYDGSVWWLGVQTPSSESIYYSADAKLWNTAGIISGFRNGGFARGFASTDGLSNYNLLLQSTVAGLETVFPASTIFANYISAGITTIDSLNATLINASTLIIGTTIVSTTYEIINNISTQNVDFLSVGITNANVMNINNLSVIFLSSGNSIFSQTDISSINNYYLSTTLFENSQSLVSSLQNYYQSTTVLDAKQVSISSLQNTYQSTSILDVLKVSISSLQNYYQSTTLLDVIDINANKINSTDINTSNLVSYYHSTTIIETQEIFTSSLQTNSQFTSKIDATEINTSNLYSYYHSTTILEAQEIFSSSILTNYQFTNNLDVTNINTSNIINVYQSTTIVDANQINTINLASYYASTIILEAQEVFTSSLLNTYQFTNNLNANDINTSNIISYYHSTTIQDVESGSISSLKSYFISTQILEGRLAILSSINVEGSVLVNQLLINQAITSSLITNTISTGILIATSNTMQQINTLALSTGTLRAGATELAGNLLLFDYGSGSGTLELRRLNNEARIITNNSAPLRMGANNSNSQIYCATNGQVGIQTNNPTYALDVNGASVRVGSVTVVGSNSVLTNAASFQHRNNENTNNFALAQFNDGRTVLNTSNNTNLTIRAGNNDMAIFQGTTSNFILKKRMLFEESGTAAAPSLSWSNDTLSNTGIYRDSENVIGFSADGTRRLAVNTEGIRVDGAITSALNVGASPSANLIMSNTSNSLLLATRLGSNSYNNIVNTDDSGIIFSRGGLNTGGNFVIAPWAIGPTGLRMLSNGLVGINNTPQYPLDVTGITRTQGDFYVGGNDNRNLIRFRGTTGDQPGNYLTTVIGENIYAGSESSELLLFKGDDGSTGFGPDRARVLTTGGFQVDIASNGAQWSIGSAPPSPSIPGCLLVNSSGNVGIRNATPATRLVVNVGAIDSLNGIAVESFNVYTIIGNTDNNGTNAGSLQVVSGTPSVINNEPYRLWLQPLGGPTFIGTCNASLNPRTLVYGRLGINLGFDATPTQQLDVSGNIYCRGTITSVGIINGQAGVQSNGNFLTSDSNIKENIESADLSICYSNINTLDLKRFNYISSYAESKYDKKQIGFIAQDVEKIFPNSILNLYNEELSTTVKHLNYDQIFLSHYGATKYLISIVEQQSTLIGSLISTVNLLQSKNP